MTNLPQAVETSISTMSQKHRNTLSLLNPNLNNHSTTSIISEAATFHSAQAAPTADMEHNDSTVHPPKAEAEFASTAMSRTDSGYEPGNGRRSASLSSTGSRRPRHSASSASPRPANKRASRSARSPSVRRSSVRSSLHSRYPTPQGVAERPEQQTPYQFFQFPSLSLTTPPSTATSVEDHQQQPTGSAAAQSLQHHHPPPPATIHYFLLPETRRLEYAAIDAASRGLRGLVTRLIPDCILPAEFRRARFHNDSDSDSDDAASVRRYRLSSPFLDPIGEKAGVVGAGLDGSHSESGPGPRPRARASAAGSEGDRGPRPGGGFWRRVAWFGRARGGGGSDETV